MRKDSEGRAHAFAWVFAALNSIEPYVWNLAMLDAFHGGEEWAKLRKPSQTEMTLARLAKLSERLGERDYLEDRFTMGDLMMTTVLRILRDSDVLQHFPNLEAYRERCEARPAFKEALADHMAPFARYAPAA